MADFALKRNDTAPELQGTLRDAVGNVVDLTGATLEITVSAAAGGAVKFSAPASVVSAVDGSWSYAWAATDTDTAGDFNFEIEVTYANGKKQTFPTIGYMTLTIAADLDAA